MADQINLFADRAALANSRFDAHVRAVVRTLLTDDVIAEHEYDPRGDHSDDLKRVLNYFRRSTSLTPYVVLCTQPFRQWRVARLTGQRHQAPVFADEQTFDSESAAEHAVFLMRVAETMRD
jgi:branched-chain amino acid transport system permease protein